MSMIRGKMSVRPLLRASQPSVHANDGCSWSCHPASHPPSLHHSSSNMASSSPINVPFPLDAYLPSCVAFADSTVQNNARAASFSGAMLLSLLAVVFLSTPRLRTQWAFRILVFALLVNLGKVLLEMQSGILRFDQIQDDGLYPSELYSRVYNVIYCLQWYIPWICDCALLCKLLSFHPATTTSWRRRAAIMAFPVAMHIPRLPLLVVASALALKVKLERWDHIFGPLSSYSMFVADGALQVAENCYCSGFLLYKAHQYARADYAASLSQPWQAHQYARADYAASSQQARRVRLGLRYFIESTLFTFLPASLLQISWLLTVTVGATKDNLGRDDDYQPGLLRADSFLRYLNTLFSVNFGLLAVWWATARIHALEAGRTGSQLMSGAAGQKNHAPQDMSLLDWTLGPIEPEANAGTADVNRPTEERKAPASDQEVKEE